MKNLLTQRLRIIPLSKEQLYLLHSENREQVLNELRLVHSELRISAGQPFLRELKDAYPHIFETIEKNPGYFEFCTHWWIIHRAENKCIGGIGFAGPADAEGQVMIGYYVDMHYENQGFATEALQSMIDFAFQEKEIKAIIADTLEDGRASQKVLLKNGFREFGKTVEELRFKLEYQLNN